MKRRRLKRAVSVFLAFVLCFSLLATNVGNGAQVVNAETQSDNSTSEESNQNAIDEETADAVAEELGLVKDSESSGIYYSSSSNMTDFRDETIYFVMTTRFYDGDSSNNVQCWDAQDKNENDPPWRGDFKGLIEKLDYIKALGFTAVWITPVVENASGYDYHGYHAIDFKEVDPRYESDDCDYQDLIDAIHARGMKVIQDVVFNHTGNWGEENLLPIATKNYSQDLSNCVASMKIDKSYAWDSVIGTYESLIPDNQFKTRCQLLMNATHDTKNIYHHNDFIKGWETYDEQVTSIAGDCIDLNTENPVVYHYLVDAYSKYIKMGVDAFRVDTVKHVSRLTFENALISELNDAYNEAHDLTGEGNFYMFGEVCTRVRGVWNRDIPALSAPFYTWKESNSYAWDDEETAAAIATNEASVKQAYEDHRSLNNEPTSNNAKLNGNEYHSTDYSKASGLNVIDFPMHWNFNSANDAFSVAVNNDQYYNDATWNVTYVDSHDYAPDGAPEGQRFAGSQAQWAENLSLMFTFRGIPCIYYGSEVEFQKGKVIDGGINTALAETGRAYFGDKIEGSVDVIDFGRYTNATGEMAKSLAYPLSQHIQRLNRLRAAIPALRKGQYSTEGCSGGMSFKRRYTDDTTDSFALIALTSDAKFTGIPGGTYVDAITGDTKTVAEGGTLTTSGIKGQGDLRVYVLNTAKTPAPGMIDGYSDYMSGGCDLIIKTVEATGVTLDKTSAELSLNETVKLTATVAPSDATNKTVTWTSSDTSVATVSGGTVTAKGKGTATITATTSNGKTATATISVKVVDVTSVTLDKTEASLDLGETVKLTATVTPANASYKDVTWTSSDESVATVSDGTVTAKEEGTTTITAATSNGKKATATVTVKATGVKVESVSVSETSVTIEKGKTAQVTATVTPADASPKYAALTWTSSDTGVATVEDGLITGVKAGTATITVKTAMGLSATVEVTVNGPVIYGNAIYFEKPLNWGSNINIYLWSGDEYKNATWPGVAMTDLGDNLYGIEWPEGKENASLKVIFNDGSNQTGDLDAKMNGYYNQSGYVKTVPVTEKPIDVDVSFADSSKEYIYDGTEKKPEVIVKSGDTTLQNGTDYEVSYQNNINAGLKTAGAKAPTVVITGKGSYENKITSNNKLTFTISPKTLTDENVSDVTGTYTYNGKEVEPRPQVSDTTTTITEDDYELSYSNNINAGTATVTVKGVGNYTGTVTKQFEIGKKEAPDNVPTDMVVAANSKLSDIELNTGWAWSDDDKDTVITAGNTVSVIVNYEGEDKANYKTVSATIQVTGTSCQHEDTSKQAIRNMAAATCTEDGYTGDTYCTDCGAMVSKGEVIEKSGHTWDDGKVTKEATATEPGVKTYTCSCGDSYTETIPATGDSTESECKHANTEVRDAKEATCTLEGYTGDIYCKDCDEKTAIGTTIAAFGHSYTSEVTKESTTTEEGARTYTCTICGDSYTEVIPKLPPESHEHSYTAQVTKEPTATEPGVRTYTCSCGDSYTEAIPKLPPESHEHSYTAQVTKEPTATEPGVRTYTCSCGDSYTETIAATGQPATDDPTTEDPKTEQPATGNSTTETLTEVTQKVVSVKTDKKNLKKGTSIKDPATQTIFRVTKAGVITKTVEYVLPNSNAKKVVIPDKIVVNGVTYKVTSVADSAFKSNENVEQVTIGTNVKTIGRNAFSGCKNLEEVTLSKNVTKIEDKAFYKCTKLKKITLPSKVNKIGKQAFYGCKNLKNITIKTTKLTSNKVGSKAFKNISSKATIKVPKSKLKAYKKLLKAKGVSSKAKIKK